MRTPLLLLALSGCAIGETIGFYDIPEGTELVVGDGPYPELLGLEEIEARGFVLLTPGEVRGAREEVDLLQADAGALLDTATLEARAIALRAETAEIGGQTATLSPEGRALLNRAASQSSRAARVSGSATEARLLQQRAAALRARASQP